MSTYDCQGTPPAWDVPGKTGQFCVLYDDCIDSLWWRDDDSCTPRYVVYRKTTCEWVCADDSDCLDHTPVTPPAPTSVPVCATPTPTPSVTPTVTPTTSTVPTPTPTTTPAVTPTPTTTLVVDPTKFYCMHYYTYAGSGCTGAPLASGTSCASGALYMVCWEPMPGISTRYDSIVSGPYNAAGCDGNC